MSRAYDFFLTTIVALIVVSVLFSVGFRMWKDAEFWQEQNAACVARGGTYINAGCWVSAPVTPK